MSEKNIYQRINAVMEECSYIQKKQSQQGKGVKYDEVMAMIRFLLVKHGIVMVMRQNSFDIIGGVEGTKQKTYQGSYELDLVNIDKPDEKVTHTAYAHGMDGGDKAPGKAHTYAAKLMLVKGFGIETGEDEESRAEKQERLNTIDADSQAFLANAINGDEKLWNMVCKAYNIADLSQLPKSKESEFSKRVHEYNRKKKANANNT